MIALIDYRAGNLRSVRIGLERAGGAVTEAKAASDLQGCSGVVLPGVGAFGQGMDNLRRQGLVGPLKEWAAAGRPLLGICLGLQLLFDESDELGLHEGLGILPGRVERLPEREGDGEREGRGRLKIPQIGWNSIERTPHADASPYSPALSEGAYYYFNNSYVVKPADEETSLATTDYGGPFCSVAGRGSVFAAQFHPEKSAEAGLRILERFVEMATAASPQ